VIGEAALEGLVIVHLVNITETGVLLNNPFPHDTFPYLREHCIGDWQAAMYNDTTSHHSQGGASMLCFHTTTIPYAMAGWQACAFFFHFSLLSWPDLYLITYDKKTTNEK
jgi:hypothetical protein